MIGGGYGEAEDAVDEVYMNRRQEIEDFVEKLGHEITEDLETSADLEATARYSVPDISRDNLALAMMYDDEISVRVDMEVEVDDTREKFTGFLTGNAYDVFDPSSFTEVESEDDIKAETGSRQAAYND